MDLTYKSSLVQVYSGKMINEHLRHRSEEKYGTIRILLIEDNPGDAVLVEVALQDADETVFELNKEQRLAPALANLSREKYDIVLLDLNLPDSQGFNTVTSVQEVVPKTPVVILTGGADEKFARRAIQVGVQDYLVKDEIRPDRLVRTIFFAIERKRTENDLHSMERLASAAISSLDLDSLLRMMLDAIRSEMSADHAALLLEENGQLEVRAAVGVDQRAITEDYLRTEKRLNQKVLVDKLPVFHELRDDPGRPEVKRTMLKAPLRIAGQVRGVLEVEWRGPHLESPREKSLMSIAADRIAIGLGNAQSYKAVKESERRAEEERLRLRIILDTLPVGIIITDARGRELESNAIRSKIWGGTPAPARNIDDLCKLKAWWADTGQPVEECPVVKALRYGQTTMSAVIDIERFDGLKATILNSAAPIKNGRGELIGAIAVQQDITEQVRLERELAESKEKAEFYIDLLTHDINNSLASTSGFLQLVDQAGGLEERQGRWVERAESALEESINLIDTVRRIQRYGKAAPEVVPVDLDQLLGEIIDQVRDQDDGRVRVELRSEDHFMVRGSDLLRDLFMNLLGNAIKHSHGPVRIEVDLRSETIQGDEYVRAEVSDDGPGIPDSMKDRLFKRGERGAAKAPGRGLGLFLALNIVNQLQGRIWVEDRIPGDYSKGSRFVVLLPRAKELGA